MFEVEIWVPGFLQIRTQSPDFPWEIWQHDPACVQSYVRQWWLFRPKCRIVTCAKNVTMLPSANDPTFYLLISFDFLLSHPTISISLLKSPTWSVIDFNCLGCHVTLGTIKQLSVLFSDHLCMLTKRCDVLILNLVSKDWACRSLANSPNRVYLLNFHGHSHWPTMPYIVRK